MDNGKSGGFVWGVAFGLVVGAVAGAAVLYSWQTTRTAQAGASPADVAQSMDASLKSMAADVKALRENNERFLNMVTREFETDGNEARIACMTSDIQTVRSQLELYKVQHQDAYPSLERFEAQLTGATDVDGNPARGNEGYGPYLRRVPANPYTDTSTVSNGPIGSSAWHYDQKTGEFRANDSEEHAKL
ncbi:MAG: hypothetical protein BIFFINMI_00264 [Phycisphaerae bacterium]|nr:hypothetical protein [Phycisphaerae bacterium]